MSELQTTEQIGSKSGANDALIAGQVLDSPPKRKMRKYDGRKNNGRYKSEAKRGPKPLYVQHMSRNSAAKVLQAYDLIAKLSDIYRAAFEQNKLELCVQMRENALNRAYGRPYQASDPNASSKPNVLEDKRLQVAIQQLVVAQPKALKG